VGHVIVVGATGLIGSAVAARLAAAGREVVAVSRGGSKPAGSTMRPVALDLAKATAEDWQTLLADAEAVVNCAGVLQSGPSDDAAGTHDKGLKVLVAACEAAGVRRFVHLSAMGVDQATPTDFSRSKLAGDAALMASGLDWVILRPSVVLGQPVYGASALMRGLAALPVLPIMPETGPLRPVVLDDVVATILTSLRPDAPARVAMNLAGPDTFAFADLVALYRSWLGWRPARRIAVPGWLAGLAYRVGDLAGRLGWRPPVRSNAEGEVARGAALDGAEWARLTGIAPQSLPAFLSAHPATVQERWFAGLYLLKPVIFVSLAVFWTGSGLASLGPGYGTGLALMREGGAAALAPLAIIAGGLADLAIGVAIAFRRTAKPALLAGLAVSLAYAVAGTLVTPWLWVDPLAPLLKIAPVGALHFVALAILEDR
jgi:uncharacterized protein YbjT (DUF2867 family)